MLSEDYNFWNYLDGGRKAHKESNSRKHNQKAPEEMSFIREKTYTLPITLARGLRIRARTKKGPTGSVGEDCGEKRKSQA